MTINAKFRSKCATCQGVIMPGDRIEWKRGERLVQHAECFASVARANGHTQDDDRGIDDENTPARARHDGRSRVSNVTTFSSGHTVYTNRRGRCEDAPCCGCCS